MSASQSLNTLIAENPLYGSALQRAQPGHNEGANGGGSDSFGMISLGPSDPATDKPLSGLPSVLGSAMPPSPSTFSNSFGKAKFAQDSGFVTSGSCGSFYNVTAQFPRGMLDTAALARARENASVPQEHQGLLASGISAVKGGASRLIGTAQAVAASTSQTVAESYPLSTQSLLVFGCMCAAGIAFMVLAFLTLPFLVFAPSKFALLFTIGSICFMVSLSSLRGLRAFLAHLAEPRRVPFTVAYGFSLVLTLYATLCVKSYLLTLVFSVVQMVALGSFLVSYIPGGKRMLGFIASSLWQMVKRAFRCKDARELPLPL